MKIAATLESLLWNLKKTKERQAGEVHHGQQDAEHEGKHEIEQDACHVVEDGLESVEAHPEYAWTARAGDRGPRRGER